MTMTFSVGSLYSQSKLDTIYVNTKQTTYILCKDSIDWFEVGNKEYSGKIMGSSFFLKPVKANTATTSLLIKSGNSHIYKTVVYSDIQSKSLYDLTLETPTKQLIKDTQKVVVQKDEDKEIESKTKKPTEFYANALQKFIEIADPYKSIASSKDRVVLSLGNIKAQGEDVFIKYNVSNYSGHRFNIEEIDLFFINQSGNLLGSNTAFETNLERNYEQTAKSIDPQQRGVLGFVVSAEQLNSKGKIFIRIKDNSGKKLLTLEIPTTLFQKS